MQSDESNHKLMNRQCYCSTLQLAVQLHHAYCTGGSLMTPRSLLCAGLGKAHCILVPCVTTSWCWPLELYCEQAQMKILLISLPEHKWGDSLQNSESLLTSEIEVHVGVC